VSLVAAGFIFIAFASTGTAQPYRPIHKRCLPSEITRYLEDLDDRKLTRFVLANIRLCGPAATPTLYKLIEGGDSNLRSLAAYGLALSDEDRKRATQILIDSLTADRASVRSRSAYALGKLEATEAVRALTKALEDPDRIVRNRAALALVYLEQIFEGHTPILIEALKDKDKELCVAAVQALEIMVEKFPSTKAVIVPALIEALKDEHAGLRAAAAGVLGIVGQNFPPTTVAVISALAEGLKDTKSGVRAACVTSLGKMSKSTGTVVPILISALEDENPEVVYDAIEILSESGLNAEEIVPILLKTLKKFEGARNNSYHFTRAFRRVGPGAVPFLIDALASDNKELKMVAIESLGDLGKDAKSAVPTLISLFSSNIFGADAADAVGSIGKEAPEIVPALVAAFDDTNAAIRSNAVLSLIISGKYRPDILQYLIAMLDTPDEEEQKKVFQAIQKLDLKAIPYLIDALNSGKTNIRSGSAMLLNKLGYKVVPALLAALKDKNARIRAGAALVFLDIHLSFEHDIQQKAVAGLVTASKDPDETVRYRAILALRSLQEDARGIKRLPPVSDMALQDEDQSIRLEAAVYLVETGFNAGQKKKIIPILISGLNETFEGPSSEIFRKIGGDSIPSLILALKHPDREVRLNAIYILGELGRDAQPAVSELVVALSDDDSMISDNAIEALMVILENKKIIVPHLISIVKNRKELSQQVLTSFESIGRDAVPELILSYEKSDNHARIRIARVFGAIGENAKEAVPVLRKDLSNGDPEVREAALIAIKLIGEEAKTIIPYLIEQLGDKDGFARHRAADLKKVAKYGIPDITIALQSKNTYVRKGAAFALGGVKPLPDNVIRILTTIMNNEDEDLDVRRVAASTLEGAGFNVESFFVKHGFVSPANAACPDVRVGNASYHYEFDIYTGKCEVSSAQIFMSGGSDLFNAIRRFFGGR